MAPILPQHENALTPWGESERRDEFAAAALTGLLANSRYGDEWARRIAERAYELADAMMKARRP